MKKFLSGLIFAILSLGIVQAQEISGVGDFKIGMTEADFLESADIKSKIQQDAAKKSLRYSNIELWKKTNESGVESSKKIHIPEYVEYEFMMPIGIKNDFGKDSYETTASFYRGNLFSIKVSLSNASFLTFQEALTEKYGKSIHSDKMKKVICQNAFGAKTEHSDGIMTWRWGDKTKVGAILIVALAGCAKGSNVSYSVADTSLDTTVMELNQKAKLSVEKEETKSKASSIRL